MIDKFCGKCNHLNYDEGEQTVVYKMQGVKPHHICTKYNKQVLHLGFHPDICRCEECLLEEVNK